MKRSHVLAALGAVLVAVSIVAGVRGSFDAFFERTLSSEKHISAQHFYRFAQEWPQDQVWWRGAQLLIVSQTENEDDVFDLLKFEPAIRLLEEFDRKVRSRGYEDVCADASVSGRCRIDSVLTTVPPGHPLSADAFLQGGSTVCLAGYTDYNTDELNLQSQVARSLGTPKGALSKCSATSRLKLAKSDTLRSTYYVGFPIGDDERRRTVEKWMDANTPEFVEFSQYVERVLQPLVDEGVRIRATFSHEQMRDNDLLHATLTNDVPVFVWFAATATLLQFLAMRRFVLRLPVLVTLTELALFVVSLGAALAFVLAVFGGLDLLSVCYGVVAAMFVAVADERVLLAHVHTAAPVSGTVSDHWVDDTDQTVIDTDQPVIDTDHTVNEPLLTEASVSESTLRPRGCDGFVAASLIACAPAGVVCLVLALSSVNVVANFGAFLFCFVVCRVVLRTIVLPPLLRRNCENAKNGEIRAKTAKSAMARNLSIFGAVAFFAAAVYVAAEWNRIYEPQVGQHVHELAPENSATQRHFALEESVDMARNGPMVSAAVMGEYEWWNATRRTELQHVIAPMMEDDDYFVSLATNSWIDEFEKWYKKRNRRRELPSEKAAFLQELDSFLRADAGAHFRRDLRLVWDGESLAGVVGSKQSKMVAGYYAPRQRIHVSRAVDEMVRRWQLVQKQQQEKQQEKQQVELLFVSAEWLRLFAIDASVLSETNALLLTSAVAVVSVAVVFFVGVFWCRREWLEGVRCLLAVAAFLWTLALPFLLTNSLLLRPLTSLTLDALLGTAVVGVTLVSTCFAVSFLRADKVMMKYAAKSIGCAIGALCVATPILLLLRSAVFLIVRDAVLVSVPVLLVLTVLLHTALRTLRG